jgi:hypothetical protein
VTPIKIDTALNLANAMTKQEHGVPESAAQLRQIAGPSSLCISTVYQSGGRVGRE